MVYVLVILLLDSNKDYIGGNVKEDPLFGFFTSSLPFIKALADNIHLAFLFGSLG